MNNIYGERLKALRKENNLTQRQLAKEIEIAPGVISDVERGSKVPSGNLAIKLADRFNTTVDHWLSIETTITKLSKESEFKQLNEGLSQLMNEGIISNVKDFDDPEIISIIIDLVKLDFRRRKILENIEKNKESK